jgi:hypothetical protein
MESAQVWIAPGPSASSKSAHFRYLEREVDQLKAYREELETSLRVNKQVLGDLIGTKPVSPSNTLDFSDDTEVSSFVRFRTFEQLLNESCRLQRQLKEIMYERDLTQSRALITEQIAEEAKRKEREGVGELEEQLSELKVLLERKEQRTRVLERRVMEMTGELQDLKEGQSVLLPLSENNLALHKQLENLKRGIALATRDLHKLELYREDLQHNGRAMASQAETFEGLLKLKLFRPKHCVKPMRRENGLDVTYDYCLEMALQSESSGSDSEEVVLPDKFEIKSTSKPKLPQLDFTKLQLRSVSVNKPQENKELKLKAKEADLEGRCKAKNQELAELRRQVGEQEQANSRLTREFKAKLSPAQALLKPKKRRSMSDLTDYLLGEDERETEAPLASARVEKDPLDLGSNRSYEEVEFPGDISSFNLGGIEELGYEEPDSSFADYLGKIDI